MIGSNLWGTGMGGSALTPSVAGTANTMSMAPSLNPMQMGGASGMSQANNSMLNPTVPGTEMSMAPTSNQLDFGTPGAEATSMVQAPTVPAAGATPQDQSKWQGIWDNPVANTLTDPNALNAARTGGALWLMGNKMDLNKQIKTNAEDANARADEAFAWQEEDRAKNQQLNFS